MPPAYASDEGDFMANIVEGVTIFHYLTVAVAELDYFETCGFPVLRHNADYVLQTCFHLLRHLVHSRVFD